MIDALNAPSADMLRAFQFDLPKLHKKMRISVFQRDSDSNASSVCAYATLTPSVFFLIAQEVGSVTVRGTKAVCHVAELSKLDKIFPPTSKDLDTDDLVHPFFGHSLRTRWYSQYFDLKTAEHVPGYGAIYWAGRQAVDINMGASLCYDLEKLKFSVECSWNGSHKKPSVMGDSGCFVNPDPQTIGWIVPMDTVRWQHEEGEWTHAV